MSVQQTEEPESRGRFHIQLQAGLKTDCVPIQSLKRQTPQSVPWQRSPWLPLQKLLGILLLFLYDRASPLIFIQALYFLKRAA